MIVTGGHPVLKDYREFYIYIYIKNTYNIICYIYIR